MSAHGVATVEEVAVFGGSFDPPHTAHALAVTTVLQKTSATRVLVVPTFEHPFGKPLTAFEHRINMCKLAFGSIAGAEVIDIERVLGGPSYTVRMLQALTQQLPNARLRFVVGADVLNEVSRWRDFETVRALAPLIVLGRSGYDMPPDAIALLPRVSSTSVRNSAQAGQLVEGDLDPKVAQYIRAHHLYQEARS